MHPARARLSRQPDRQPFFLLFFFFLFTRFEGPVGFRIRFSALPARERSSLPSSRMSDCLPSFPHCAPHSFLSFFLSPIPSRDPVWCTPPSPHLTHPISCSHLAPPSLPSPIHLPPTNLTYRRLGRFLEFFGGASLWAKGGVQVWEGWGERFLDRGMGLRGLELLGLLLRGFPGFCDFGWWVWQDAILPGLPRLSFSYPFPFFSALCHPPLSILILFLEFQKPSRSATSGETDSF